MKFKLDENFGSRIQEIFQEAGYEAFTVRDQKLQGCLDKQLFDVCSFEKICLVTLDKDFSDVIRFNPNETNGIVVIRPPRNSSHNLLKQLIYQFLQALKKMRLKNNLWIVEVGRIRIHQEVWK